MSIVVEDPYTNPTNFACRVYLYRMKDGEKGMFAEWMDTNMQGLYVCDLMYNSGSPEFYIHLTSEEDIALFKLTWM